MYRVGQIETNCRKYFKAHLERKITIENTVRKRKNCLLQAISPFLTLFSTAISLVCQNAALCGNGLTDSRKNKTLYISLLLKTRGIAIFMNPPPPPQIFGEHVVAKLCVCSSKAISPQPLDQI